jgi:dTDP-4-amino-4,6-dideoxygalactose transaminase
MRVNYNYLQQEFKNPKKIFKEWKKLIKSTDFTLGRYIKKFEKKFASFVKSKYCISTNNGTDALILSLKALGIKSGDEVITVCNSFYATVGAIVCVGATPIFVDSDNRYQIDTNQIEKKITNKTKAIMPVHWGGSSPDIIKICKIAKKYNIKVIEDACMGIGASINGKHTGTFGDIGAFSMHPLKSLNAMGDGGAIITNDKKIYKWLQMYRNHGMISRDKINIWGVNCRMQPFQAIVLIEGLKKLKKVIKQRQKNASFYDEELKKLYPNIRVPERLKNYKETNALYMIFCQKRNLLKKFLEKKKIEVKIHYPIPLHKQKAFLRNNKKQVLVNADRQSRELLTLPVHQFLKKKQLIYIVKCINNFYKKY